MCGDTEFEKRCCTPKIEGNEIKKVGFSAVFGLLLKIQ
jgi:hypothetical protein